MLYFFGISCGRINSICRIKCGNKLVVVVTGLRVETLETLLDSSWNEVFEESLLGSSLSFYEGYIRPRFMESLRGIIPVFDRPGLLPFIRGSNNKDKSFLFPELNILLNKHNTGTIDMKLND